MGWSGGAEIFDSVAINLVLHGVHRDEVRRQILNDLIDKLTDADWDTCDESLQRFKDDSLIVSLFADHGFFLDDDEADEETDTESVYAQVAEAIVTFPWWDFGLDSMMGLESEEWAQALARRIVDGLALTKKQE